MAAQPAYPLGPEIQVTAGHLGFDASPQVAVFADGGFAVVWGVQRSNAYGSKRVMHARVFAADGTPATGEFLLATGPAQVQTPDALIVDATGNLFLLWEQDDPETLVRAVFGVRLSRSGALIGRPLRINDASPLPRYAAAAALAPDGTIVVAWTADAPVPTQPWFTTCDAYLRRLDSRGRPSGPELDVYPGDEFTMPQVNGIGVAPDGSFTLAYSVGDDNDYAAFQRVAADGTPGAPQPVAFDLFDTSRQEGVSLSMAADGSFTIAWDADFIDYQGVIARFFAPDATPRSSELRVSPPRSGDEVLGFFGGGTAPLPGGGFTVVWEDDVAPYYFEGKGIYIRSYGAGGSPLTRALRLDQAGTGDHFSPVIAASQGGPATHLVAVWIQSAAVYRPPATIVARRLQAVAPLVP